jgi:hypothetical protein
MRRARRSRATLFGALSETFGALSGAFLFVTFEVLFSADFGALFETFGAVFGIFGTLFGIFEAQFGIHCYFAIDVNRPITLIESHLEQFGSFGQVGLLHSHLTPNVAQRSGTLSYDICQYSGERLS